MSFSTSYLPFAEVYEFVLHNYHELKFGTPQEFQLEIKWMNPKRLQREVRCEMSKVKKTTKPSTHVQDYMREEQFSLKQKKKKEKHRGN